MTPPGLALVAVSERAMEAARERPARSFYFDWQRTRKAQAKLDAPFTPPVSLVRGLDVALGLLLEEGLEAAFERHVRLGRACREGVKAMGSSSSRRTRTAPPSSPPRACRTGLDSGELVLALRDRFGITIAGGQGELKGKIFRIGHIGWFDVFDITTALAAVELALAELGADIERGVAVTRALEALRARTRVSTRPRSSSGSRSPTPASSSSASASTSTSTATPTSRRRSATTTRSSSARRRS